MEEEGAMFEDFNKGDISNYLSKKKAINNAELIKTNYVESIKIVENNKSVKDELFKGYDFEGGYSEYLSKRRGEITKNNPLFQLINTGIAEEEVIETPEDSFFKNLKEGKNLDMGDYIHKNKVDKYKQTPIHDVWIESNNKEVLNKTIGKLAFLYKEVGLEGKLTKEHLNEELSKRGYTKEASKTIAAFLYKNRDSLKAATEKKKSKE